MGIGVEQIRDYYARHISGDSFITELTKYQSKWVLQRKFLLSKI